jgi:hypothetical protein
LERAIKTTTGTSDVIASEVVTSNVITFEVVTTGTPKAVAVGPCQVVFLICVLLEAATPEVGTFEVVASSASSGTSIASDIDVLDVLERQIQRIAVKLVTPGGFKRKHANWGEYRHIQNGA